MYLKRLVIRNFRNFDFLDIALHSGVTCLVGENNSGKTNLLHALRIVLDARLSSQYRQLDVQDIHSAVDTTKPFQVIISVEFTDFNQSVHQHALVSAWQLDECTARLTYRFRPRAEVIEAIESDDIARGSGLILEEDFHWQLAGGGEVDPARIEWDQDLGGSVRFQDLQHFKVEFLPALRDLKGDLRQSRLSPLGLLFESADLPQDEQKDLIQIVSDANTQIADRPTISSIGSSIQQSLDHIAGEAFRMDVRVGFSDPSLASVIRSLTLLLSDSALTDFDTTRNGLGMNNILYISSLLQYFRQRISNPLTAGQLLLIEEPEAHLHPQLQRVLYAALAGEEFQAILTTHSTHISSQAPLRSVITLTRQSGPAVVASSPARQALTANETADLERYLDATRSTLLFARKAMLVEGPAELFLIPPLVKTVAGVDLDRLGISVVPIYGTHFSAYTKLFGSVSLPKKCAVVADGDSSSSNDEASADDEPLTEGDNFSDNAKVLQDLDGPHVRVFLCGSTFEREITLRGTLCMLEQTARELRLSKLTAKVIEAQRRLGTGTLENSEIELILGDLGSLTLSAAKRVGKGRFAQVASKYSHLATELPAYILAAVKWLVED